MTDRTAKLPTASQGDHRLKVLIVKESHQDAELLIQALTRTELRVQCTHVVTKSDYQAALSSSPDLILADFASSQFRELETLDLMQSREHWVPFIFVSTTGGEEKAVAAMKSGADDFLVQADLQRLGNAVREALSSHRLRAQRPALEQQQHKQKQALRERVKELATLHHASSLLQQDDQPLPTLMQRLVDSLPAAWQFPEIAAARVTLDDREYVSAGFMLTRYRQTARFNTGGGRHVCVDIVYLEPPTVVTARDAAEVVDAAEVEDAAEVRDAAETFFLAEEREWLKTLSGMLRNSLERREAKQVLDRDSLLLSQVQDAAIVTDVAGRVTYWNIGATRLFGWTAEEMLGQPLAHRYPEPKRDWITQQIQERLSGQDWKGEFRDWRKDGTRVWIDANVTRLVDQEGDVVGVLSISRDITARKESEAAVESGERRYRDLVESSHDLIWTIDAESRITFINQAAKAIYGWDSHELIGKSFLEFVTPESFDETLTTFITLVETGTEQLNYKCGVFRKDGSVVTLSTNVRALRDPQGKITGLSGISRDLTQWMNATDELREREVLLSNAERIANMGCWDIDLRLGTFQGSAQTFELFGIASEQCSGSLECLMGRVHVQDRESVLASLSRTDSDQPYAEHEFRIQRPNGEIRLVRERGEMVLDETGNAIRRLGVIQDITEQEQNIVALRNSEERFKLAVDGSSAGIWDWDIQTGELYYSPRFKQLLGYSDDEFPHIFSSFASALHPDDKDQFKSAIEAHFNGNKPYDTEFRLRTKSGHYRWFNARGDALRDETGKPYRMAGSTLDIHVQKKVEQDLRDIRGKQRQLIEQLEVKQARLSEAQAVAKIGSWETDLRTMTVFWSDETYAIFGKQPESFAPTHANFLKLVHPEDRKRVNAALVQSLDSGASCKIEHRILLENGTEKWVEEFWRASNDDQGQPVYAIGTCRDISEAKRAEEKLHRLNEELESRVEKRTAELLESSRRHQTLLANLQGMAYRCRDDADWTMEFVSEGCRDLFGISPEELTQGHFLYPSLVHPDDLAQVAAVFASKLQARQPIQHEYRIRTPDGQMKWVWEQARGIYDEQGRVEAIEGLVSDITDRKLRELRENHQSQLLRMLAADESLDACLKKIVSSVVAEDTALMCNLMLTDRSKTSLSNRAALHLSQDYLQAIDDSEVQAHGSPFCRAAFTKRQVIVHDMQSESPCHAWADQARQAGIRSCWSMPILSVNDELLGTLSVYTDQPRKPSVRERECLEWATELSRLAIEHTFAKQSLIDSEAFNRVTLDALSAHIAVLDSRGEIVATNQAWKRFAKTSCTEVQGVSEGKNYFEICAAAIDQGNEDARKVLAAVREIEAGKRDSWSFQYTCHSPGEQRWFQLRMRRIYVKGEVHILMAHENVTSVKQSEAALRSAVVHAEEASRAKSDFLATMSHELRTPLNGILGMNELLRTTTLTGRQQQFVEAGYKSGQRLLALIDDILDLSKIEAGKLELEPRECKLAKIVEDVVAANAPLIAGKGLGLDCLLSPELDAIVRCDDHRLCQILANLLSNALKFTTRGGITLRGEQVSRTGTTARIRVSVTDTGLGIPEDRMNRLFKAFSQVDSSTTRQFGGTGLGLSICMQLVQLMEGEMGVRSRHGQGSTFWFEIPVEILQENIHLTSPAGSPRTAQGAPLHSPAFSAHILVAEDNLTNQFYISELLKHFGCTCEVVTNGEEAIEAIGEHHYDLILMDCQMPKMDGFSATREIRKREQAVPLSRRIPIVALTANSLAGDRDRCLQAGMDDYISKPVQIAQLQAIVRELLGAPSGEVAP